MLLIGVKVAAQQKYKFTKKKFEVFEPVGVTDSSFQISILANNLPAGVQIDSLKLFDERSGDAGVRDYKIADTLPLTILIHKGSQKTFDFYFYVKHDKTEEKTEDVILVLKYNGRNAANNRDSALTDTTIVVIKDQPKPTHKDAVQDKIAEIERDSFSKSFVLLDTSFYTLKIQDKTDGHTMKVCRTINNEVAKDTCWEAMLIASIGEPEFRFHFKRLISKVGTIDNNAEGGATKTDNLGSRIYLEWKNFLDNKKQKITNVKESGENVKKYNALQDSISKIVNALLLRADTSYSFIGSTLRDIQLYRRRIVRVPEPKKGLIDPLSIPYDYLEYFWAKDSTINFDSITIRIDNGFLERIILSPSTAAKQNYGFNDHTTIRKHYDLRNTTDVADILNMYLPLESTRAYIKIDWEIDSLTNDTLFFPKGFKDFKSKDNPRNYYYSKHFVRLGDVLQYSANPDSLPDVLRHLKNINLTFRLNQVDKVKLRDKDFNSFSQLNIFTDLVGLSEDKPNGLIQAEGKFETGIFSQPVGNKSYYSKVKVKMLPSAYAAFTISKVENKLRYYVVPKDSVILFNESSEKHDDTTNRRKYIKNIDILQYSTLLLNARFNLISVESDFAQIRLYVEGGIIRTAVNDTTNGKDNLGNSIVRDSQIVVNSLKTTWGISIKLKSNSKLGVDFGIEWQRATLNNTLLTQVYASYDKGMRKEVLKESKYQPFPSFNPQMIIPNVNIYYFLDRDFQNRIYLRGRYFKELKSRSDNLLFVQFGYSTDLNGFFGLFKKRD